MKADKAREILQAHRQSLKEPTLKDIYSYVERAAKMGDNTLHYGVSYECKTTEEVIKSLNEDGYKVKEIPQDSLLVLEIKWE